MMSLLALVGCEHRPSMVAQRKAEIRWNDMLELVQAKNELAAADSVEMLKSLEVNDLKGQFAFEKKPEYQTTGYYVLPSYEGGKERFSFFPEVEENGKLLLVSIDKQRQYSFVEVDLDGKDYTAQLPAGLSEAQRKGVEKCYVLAKAMHDLDVAKKQKEKLELKVRFYEKKLAGEPSGASSAAPSL